MKAKYCRSLNTSINPRAALVVSAVRAPTLRRASSRIGKTSVTKFPIISLRQGRVLSKTATDLEAKAGNHSTALRFLN